MRMEDCEWKMAMQSIWQSTSEAHKRELFVPDRTLLACRPQIQD